MFDSKFEKEEFVKNNFKNILETRHHSISKYIFQEFFQQLRAYEISNFPGMEGVISNNRGLKVYCLSWAFHTS